MRRSVALLSGGGLVEYHEWHLHEPQLQNYEGWRILDNPQYDKKSDAYIYDLGGSVRHIDPIIDDPRLTHKQRVSRLYRWALKELQMWLVQNNEYKFNLAYKVVRRRFEQYRYVTDPATCDMMVRQTQKYLRDTANPHYMRRNTGSPWSTATQTNPMFHPDGAQVYDHWTHPEVFWYDDAKLHRWRSHHPNNGGAWEKSDRFGDADVDPYWRPFMCVLLGLTCLYMAYHVFGLSSRGEDVVLERWCRNFEPNLAGALYAEERNQRSRGSVLGGDWDRILGIKPVDSQFRLDKGAAEQANAGDASAPHGVSLAA